MVLGSRSMSTRRAFFVLLFAALLCGASGMRAQQAAAPPAPPDALMFTGESAMIIFQVKPDKAADFESAWAAIRDKLSKTDKADYKELGDSLKIFKVSMAAPPAGANVVYVFQINSPSKKLSYDPVKLLYNSGLWERKDADEIYKKIAEGIDSLSALPLSKVGG